MFQIAAMSSSRKVVLFWQPILSVLRVPPWRRPGRSDWERTLFFPNSEGVMVSHEPHSFFVTGDWIREELCLKVPRVSECSRLWRGGRGILRQVSGQDRTWRMWRSRCCLNWRTFCDSPRRKTDRHERRSDAQLVAPLRGDVFDNKRGEKSVIEYFCRVRPIHVEIAKDIGGDETFEESMNIELESRRIRDGVRQKSMRTMVWDSVNVVRGVLFECQDEMDKDIVVVGTSSTDIAEHEHVIIQCILVKQAGRLTRLTWTICRLSKVTILKNMGS